MSPEDQRTDDQYPSIDGGHSHTHTEGGRQPSTPSSALTGGTFLVLTSSAGSDHTGPPGNADNSNRSAMFSFLANPPITPINLQAYRSENTSALATAPTDKEGTVRLGLLDGWFERLLVPNGHEELTIVMEDPHCNSYLSIEHKSDGSCYVSYVDQATESRGTGGVKADGTKWGSEAPTDGLVEVTK